MSGLCIPQDILDSFHQYTAFLQVWGYVTQWQPHGRSHPSRSPGCVKLPGLVRRKVATGTAHSVLLRSDGRVVACGDNRAGKPGSPAGSVPFLEAFQEVVSWGKAFRGRK